METIINFAWPHERFSFGWEINQPDEVNNFRTITIFLGIMLIQFNW